MRDTRGITLIALIITIIVLIILAGLSINLLLGQDGIITRAKKGAMDYEEEAIREKVELALTDYNIDNITTNEEARINEALNNLLGNDTFEDIDTENNIGMIGDYEITLTTENGKVIIEDIEKVTGSLRIRCKLNEKGYTNKNITIEVRVTGNVVKLIKPDNKEVLATNGKIQINYEISENKTYLFIAEDVEGNRIEKEVIIDKIDTLPPKDFTITANQVDIKLVITAEAQDEEATQTSVKSGIDKYEYFVKKSTDTKYPETPYTANEIEITEYGTYNVFVKAYDKAGNSKDCDKEVTIEIANPKISKYGQKVNYSANGVEDWKIFYINDETNETFIITGDCLQNTKLPIDKTGISVSNKSGIRWATLPNYVDISENVRNKFLMSWNRNTTNANIICVSTLLNTNAWDDLVTTSLKERGALAIGSPTLEMFVKSWNEVHSTNQFPEIIDDNNGLFFYDDDLSSTWYSLKCDKDPLYFPSDNGYYFSSPSSKQNDGCRIFGARVSSGYGRLCADHYNVHSLYKVRPVICIPSDILKYNINSSSWDINVE